MFGKKFKKANFAISSHYLGFYYSTMNLFKSSTPKQRNQPPGCLSWAKLMARN